MTSDEMLLFGQMLQEAQDPRTPAVRLEEMGRFTEASHFGTQHFGCEDETLLQAYRGIGEAVAQHPSTPPDLLLTLAKPFPQAVLQNPILPLLLLEDPGWMHGLQPSAVLSLLRFENVPPAVLSGFADGQSIHSDLVRLHVGRAGEAGPGWKREVQEAFWELMGSRSWCERIPVRLLALGLIPDWLLEPLATHYDARVRRAAARHPCTPPCLLTTLRRAGSTSDLGGLAPPDLSLPVPVLERLARGGPWAQRLAARHPNTPPDVLEQLAKGIKAISWGDWNWVKRMVNRSLLRNPGTPAAVWEELAQAADTAAETREANWEGKQARRRRADTHEDRLLRMDSTDERILAEQRLDTPDDYWMAARNPKISTAALRVIAQYCDCDLRIRLAVARNPNTNSVTLIKLAQDPDRHVRLAVGRNAATGADTLAVLADDPVHWIRFAVARHPLAPPHVLDWLADDDEESVRQAVLRRLETSPEEAAQSQDLPDTGPAERVQALAEAEKRGCLIMMILLACPDTAPQLLADGAAETEWLFRLAVARNPAAFLVPLAVPGTEDILHSLAHDGNRYVRAAAREVLASAGEESLS